MSLNIEELNKARSLVIEDSNKKEVKLENAPEHEKTTEINFLFELYLIFRDSKK